MRLPDRDGWERLISVRSRGESLCIGLMSGTSADGVEAALCRIRGTGGMLSLHLVKHLSVPFPKALSTRVIAAKSAMDVAELDTALGERFGLAANALLEEAAVAAADVDFISSHGQTLVHLPPRLSRFPSSLQVGEPGVIAELTRLPVICDFRPRDMAAGGEGAPLVPYADWALFRKPGTWRALQNIGGIANVSVVGDRLSDTIAFDTGPGNMLLDAFARKVSRHGFDRGGSLSRRGEVIPELLKELLKHPFLRRRPPKSAGRENFGAALADDLWARYRRRPYELIATAAAFTVESIAQAYERFILPSRSLEAVYVAGGGSRNPTLMQGLTERLAPVPVRSFSELGFPEAAKEAACFALLGHECVMGTPQNVPSATGARHPAVLGKIVF
ncbi:MAG: anhydro-N-acetylmuramic acid kinase [Myxococcaceae bacterium]